LTVELLNTALASSNALSEHARLSMSTVLVAHEDTISAALIEEARQNVENTKETERCFNELFGSALRYSYTSRNIICRCIKQSWETDNKAVADLQEIMASFSRRFTNVAKEIHIMRKTIRWKGMVKVNIFS